jgi:hypothetical protein
MTSLEKLSRANRWRVRSGKFATSEVDGFNGSFIVPLEGEIWHVRISDGWGFRHASITNAQKKQLPPYQIMCRVKESFYADDAWVVQYFPPKEEHINDHPLCLHLWESIDKEMPTPHFTQV